MWMIFISIQGVYCNVGVQRCSLSSPTARIIFHFTFSLRKSLTFGLSVSSVFDLQTVGQFRLRKRLILLTVGQFRLRKRLILLTVGQFRS